MSSKRPKSPRDLIGERREAARRIVARNVADVQAPILRAQIERAQASSLPQPDLIPRLGHGAGPRPSDLRTPRLPVAGSVADLQNELSTVLAAGSGALPKRGDPVVGLQPLLTGEGFAKGSSRPRKSLPQPGTRQPGQLGNLFSGAATTTVSRAIAPPNADTLSRVGLRGASRGRSGRPDQTTGPTLGGAFGVGSSTILGSS